MARHVKICLTPRTLDRLYEIGSVDTSLSGCWRWTGVHGHDEVHAWYPRVGRVKVMRLVSEFAYGPPEDPRLRPLHSCDNLWCVRVDHLRWGTQGENVQDAYDHGRRGRRYEQFPVEL